MPVYEFAEIREEHAAKKHMPVRKGMGERINYWGYGKAYYFAPKASYSASGDPVKELKMLVRELHKNGIELILEFYFPEGIRPGLVLDCIRHLSLIHIYVEGDLRCYCTANKKDGKVAIITGGGTGHLPLFLGYVGDGLLDGCGVGGVFQSCLLYTSRCV